MDFLELLLLFVFFVLPLLQALFGRKDEDAAPPTREQAKDAGEDAPSRWSGGGGEWPYEAESIAGREVVEEHEAEALAELQGELSEEHVPEAVRVSVPVVSMESEVDRAEQHGRFHKRYMDAAPRAEPPPIRPLDAALRNASEVWRAVILSEVLGPPRSLQEPD